MEFRESLPKTIVGKVLRRALREEEEQKRAQRKKRRHDADAAQPAGTTEEPLGHA